MSSKSHKAIPLRGEKGASKKQAGCLGGQVWKRRKRVVEQIDFTADSNMK
jgi:hypothetical protein